MQKLLGSVMIVDTLDPILICQKLELYETTTTLVDPTRENLVLHPQAALILDNHLYILGHYILMILKHTSYIRSCNKVLSKRRERKKQSERGRKRKRKVE